MDHGVPCFNEGIGDIFKITTHDTYVRQFSPQTLYFQRRKKKLLQPDKKISMDYWWFMPDFKMVLSDNKSHGGNTNMLETGEANLYKWWAMKLAVKFEDCVFAIPLTEFLKTGCVANSLGLLNWDWPSWHRHWFHFCGHRHSSIAIWFNRVPPEPLVCN